jgi:thioredoxin-dependent peroxiredoxin
MLAPGEMAPDFEGTTASGSTLRLSSLRGRHVVLYFYPKAMTLGCTRESRAFALQYPALKARGAEVIGVSVDDADTQRTFQQRCDLPFPLIADVGGAISRSYGVLGPLGRARRVTFFLRPDGRVDRIVRSMRPGPHSREATLAFGDR